jgi:hypothetical protein
VERGQSAIWRDLEQGAPELARLGLSRLHAARVAFLGTVRRDGSARISPIEPYLIDGQVLIGAMAWSRKVDDLRRDPRYILHSAITDPDSAEGELKLHGVAVELGEDLRPTPADAWWSTWPADRSVVFALHITQAMFVEWDTGAPGLMTTHRWSRQSGYSKTHRNYP